MLTGVAPFAGYTDIARAHIESTAQSPSRRNPNAPRGFDLVVMTCLAKDPEARFSSCAEVLSQLDRIGGDGNGAGVAPALPTAPRPVPAPPPTPVDPHSTRRSTLPPVPARRTPVLTIAGAAVVLLLLALLFAYRSRPVSIRMYGSSSVGDELAPVLAAAFL